MTIKGLYVRAGETNLSLSDTFLNFPDSLNTAQDPGSARHLRKSRQEWHLTEEALQKLLTWLHPETSPATEEYERVRERLVRYFDSNGCAASDACADLTIDRVAKRIMEGEIIHHKWGYLRGVAANVLSEYRRTVATAKEFSLTATSIPALPDAAEETARVQDLLEDCRKYCLWCLPREQRVLVIRYYVGEPGIKLQGARQQLAAEIGCSLNALRQRINEIRAKLARCAEACMARELSRS